MRSTAVSGLLLSGLSLAAAAAGVLQQPIGGRPVVDDAEASRTPGSSTLSSKAITPPYREALLSLHSSLVDTVSLVGLEGNVGTWLVDYLEQRNYTVVTQEVLPRANTPRNNSRRNVLAWPGRTTVAPMGALLPPTKVLVTSHIDVVPPHIGYDIADGTVTSETEVRGRGSVDAKGSVAAQIIAVEALRADGALTDGDVALLFVTGEEDSGDGMKAFSQRLYGGPDSGAGAPGDDKLASPFSAAIFGEPTDNRLACGHKGILGATIAATGTAGHSGYPALGKSANELLARGLIAVVDSDLGSSPRYGNTTVNIGLVRGGVAANVIPAAAEAQLAIRVAMGPQYKGHLVVRERLEAALRSVDAEALAVEFSHGYGAIECNCDVEGFDTMTASYGTDVPNLAGNHTRYLYGPGSILVAHSDHEALTVGDLETAVEGFKSLIQHALDHA